MSDSRKQGIERLLKGIETGDPASVEVVSAERYIQHNPQTREGGEGLAALFKRLAKSSPRVNIVRLFSDGDFVFGHTEYDFDTSRIGFEIFRFEGESTVEHWDNIQLRLGPNASGHSMVDGPVVATGLEQTGSNRELVQGFITEVLIGGELDRLEHYVKAEAYIEHNPGRSDDLDSLRLALSGADEVTGVKYDKLHRILAEGNFVLAVSEGSLGGVHTSFFDLFRVEADRIVEHWDTVETVPPRAEWLNDNGKF